MEIFLQGMVVLYALAFASGLVAWVRFWTLYRMNRFAAGKKYLRFLTGYSVMIGSSLCAIYIDVNIGFQEWLQRLFLLGIVCSAHLLCWVLPDYVQTVSSPRLSPALRRFFMVSAALLPLNALFFLTTPLPFPAEWSIVVALGLFAVAFGHTIVRQIVTYRKGGTRDVSAPFVGLFTIFALLLVGVEQLLYAQVHAARGYSLSLPITYIMWNGMSLWLERSAASEGQAGGSLDKLCRPFQLTAQEVRVVQQLLTGKSSKEIATQLCISPHTVKNHLTSIFSKTATTGRVELICKFSASNPS
jgi:DNA-binding CsgD family transcriptional regulator